MEKKLKTQTAKFLRYRVLDELFRDLDHKYDLDDLIRVLGERIDTDEPLQPSTVRHDIAYMRNKKEGLRMEIIGHGRPVKYYRYKDVNQRCKELENISDGEQGILKNAITALSGFKSPQYKWATLYLKMAAKTGGETDDSCVSFQNNDELVGMDFFEPLLAACIEHRCQTICYKPYNKPERVYNLSPYWLKQYNNRWFLIGRDRAISDFFPCLALDRIVSIEDDDRNRYLMCHDSVDNYFNNVIGVSKHRDARLLNVELRVSAERIDYIRTKPFCSWQKIEKGEGDSWIVRFKTSMNVEVPSKNRELIQTLLSYGDDVEVLQPDFLRDEMRRRVNNMLDRYNK